MSSILHIKNMVCPRCISAVSRIFKDLEIETTDIQLGEIILKDIIPAPIKEQLATVLSQEGFELIVDKNTVFIAKIKSLIIDSIRNKEGENQQNYSVLISKKIGEEYTFLSRLFSSIEGITIEKHILKQKIEYVKELLFYKEYTLSEIAFKLDYSSAAHLSNQFKQQTGMTPSTFKKLKKPSHTSLDNL